MALDYLTYMCDDVLVKVDRASMLTSLEVRAPLLDPAIVEFAFGRLAPDQRVQGRERKRLLRLMAAQRLPAWFDVTRKQGFSIPLASWLRGSWAPLIQDLAENPGTACSSRTRFAAFWPRAGRRAASRSRFSASRCWNCGVANMA